MTEPCYCPAGRPWPVGHPRHAGCWKPDPIRPRCPGSGQRTRRPGTDEPDRCPVCNRIAYVRLDGTTGVHYR